jgi:hypothetical protein
MGVLLLLQVTCMYLLLVHEIATRHETDRELYIFCYLEDIDGLI